MPKQGPHDDSRATGSGTVPSMVLSRLFRYPPAVLAEAALAARLPASARCGCCAPSLPPAPRPLQMGAAAANSLRSRFIASHGPPGRLQVLPAALADETDASYRINRAGRPGVPPAAPHAGARPGQPVTCQCRHVMIPSVPVPPHHDSLTAVRVRRLIPPPSLARYKRSAHANATPVPPHSPA
jgi:hypothetical protein